MPWRDFQLSHCRLCQRKRKPGERFSARGRCWDCGFGNHVAEITQLAEHRGPYFEHWRERVAASVGATLREET